jgi:hypothetical protein
MLRSRDSGVSKDGHQAAARASRSRGTICPSDGLNSSPLDQRRNSRPSSEGAGKTGCPPHPQPRVQLKKHTSVVATGGVGSLRPSLRNGFNGLLRALPGDRAFLPPSPARRRTRLRGLECQRRGIRTTRLGRPRKRASSQHAAASTASRTNVRDDAYAPLIGRDGAGDSSDFSSEGSEISLPGTLDRGSRKRPVGQISGTMAQT